MTIQKIPTSIGPYKIKEKIKESANTIIYLGIDSAIHEFVFVKVITSPSLSDPDMARNFLIEAHRLGSANHTNIIKLLGEGMWEGHPYIVTENYEGIPLSTFLLGNPLPFRKALKIILKIAAAVAHLHGLGIIHGCINPESIIVTSSEEIKLIDFGIVRGKSGESQSGSSETTSRSPYQTPEIGVGELSYASDIYSIGVVAYELILGKKSQGHFFPSLLPESAQKVIYKAIQENPADRYQDIIDFIEAIKAILKELLTTTSPTSKSLTTKKEKLDPLEEIYRRILAIQHSLLPLSTPHWPYIDIAVINYQGIQLAGVYYDFIKLPGQRYGVVIAEPVSNGIEGFVYTAMLRGMIRGMVRFTLDPEILFQTLNQNFLEDHVEESFNLCYLELDPQQNKFCFITSGKNALFFIKKELRENKTNGLERLALQNFSLGIDPNAEFKVLEHSLNPGDTILMHSFGFVSDAPHSEFNNSDLEQSILQCLEMSPQGQVESIFQKKKQTVQKSVIERPIMIMSIQRGA